MSRKKETRLTLPAYTIVYMFEQKQKNKTFQPKLPWNTSPYVLCKLTLDHKSPKLLPDSAVLMVFSRIGGGCIFIGFFLFISTAPLQQKNANRGNNTNKHGIVKNVRYLLSLVSKSRVLFPTATDKMDLLFFSKFFIHFFSLQTIHLGVMSVF